MLVVVSTAAALLTLASPFAAGDPTWARLVTTVLIAGTGLYALRVRTGRPLPGIGVTAAVVLAALATLHWAAHHEATPFEQLYVLPGLLVAAFAGPAQTVAIFVAIAAAQMSPVLAPQGDAADQAAAVTQVTVVAGLLVLAHLWGRSGRRRERVLVDERRRVEREVRRDALTGLPNRRAFEEELSFAARRGDAVAVVLLDLNGFKEINDRFGHLEGDRKLTAVAQAIRDALRGEDLACRWAGDEFALLLRSVSTEQAEETARRVDAHVRSMCTTPDGRPLSLKWGVAATTAGGAAAELMRAADAALVRATTGRGARVRARGSAAL